MNGADDKRQEIIIVRRGGGDHEDGHHGGVWKIAFADFMTAMMCFFLVMWLVNAASEDTKASVASYFNPMSLMEPTPAGSGVDDPGVSPRSPEDHSSEADKAAEEQPSQKHEIAGPGQHANSVDSAQVENTSDRHLFSDPYAVLAEIAADTGMLQNISDRGDGGAQDSGPATGAQGGESYRDPFAPDFWSSQVSQTNAAELEVFREQQEEASQVAALSEETIVPDQVQPPLEQEAVLDPLEAAATVEVGTDQLLPELPEEEAKPASATAELAETLREQLSTAFGEGSELNQTVSVVETARGVLISVTDELNYGMFEIGSAVPQRQLVLAMERIGQTLREQPGDILINGHTDGRPFRSAEYDNWRLSTARAHSAYYMLIRAGLDETRIKAVAGFADRELKTPDNPNADVNRRIEILLETNG
jgi:chemotaxis protein MotB